MAILTASGLSQTYGAKDLFKEINLEIQAKARIGLVGPNGVGKTTLLRVLAGLLEPTTGSMWRAPDLSLGYLRQEAVLTFAGQDNTIYQEMLSVFADLREMESKLRAMEAMMAAGESTSRLLQEYGRLQDQYDLAGGYEYQVDIKRVLLGLGFEQPSLETPLIQLSGGQKTRVLLGRLLLEKPDLLILDEPTNHLDVSAVEWLERTLQEWAGALVLVSHDRYFLNRIVNRVWDMSSAGIRTYRGNYGAYMLQKRLEREREIELFRAEQERLGAEIAFIRKHIAGGKTDIAKGKLKRLTRDLVLMEQASQGDSLADLQSKSWSVVGGRVRTLSINQAVKRFRALEPPGEGASKLSIHLQTEQRSGRVVMRTGELEIGYEHNPLFTTERIKLDRGERVALIGPNGSGKSTFFHTLMGEVKLLRGWIKFGDNVRRGYFAQGHDQLSLNRRVLDEVTLRSDLQEGEARSYLAPYLFRGDDVFKKVRDLSGGERGRLSLALLALDSPNLLLLDEPTNHLDIPSQEVLQSVLERYEGTILLISHDRYLIDRLATQIWDLQDGTLQVYIGSYQEYLLAKEQRAYDLSLHNDIESMVTTETSHDLSWVDDLVIPPVAPRQQRKHKHRLDELYREIEDAEAWLERIGYESEQAREQGDEAWLAQLRDEYVVMNARLEELNAEWERLDG